MVLAGKQRPRTHPRMTHPRMSTRTQRTGMGSTAAEHAPWKESSLGHPKAPHMLPVFPGLQCWLSLSSLLLQEEISEKHLLDFNFFLFRCPVTLTLKSLCDLKAGIQRACYKRGCEGCSDRRCFLPAADRAPNILTSSSQTLGHKWDLAREIGGMIWFAPVDWIPLLSVKDPRVHTVQQQSSVGCRSRTENTREKQPAMPKGCSYVEAEDIARRAVRWNTPPDCQSYCS